MRKITILFVLYFCWLTTTYACSCVSWKGKGFCDFVDYSDVIIDGTVVERTPNRSTIKVRVNEIFKGSDIPTVLEFSITMCSSWISEDEGEQFILGLNRYEEAGQPERFLLGGCGIYHLQIKGNQVKGEISKKKSSMSYKAFKELIKTQACPVSGPSFSFIWEGQDLRVVTPYERYTGEIGVRMYDVQGQIVNTFDIRLEDGESSNKTMERTVSTGIYVMYIEVEDYAPQVEKVMIR